MGDEGTLVNRTNFEISNKILTSVCNNEKLGLVHEATISQYNVLYFIPRYIMHVCLAWYRLGNMNSNFIKYTVL